MSKLIKKNSKKIGIKMKIDYPAFLRKKVFFKLNSKEFFKNSENFIEHYNSPQEIVLEDIQKIVCMEFSIVQNSKLKFSKEILEDALLKCFKEYFKCREFNYSFFERIIHETLKKL